MNVLRSILNIIVGNRNGGLDPETRKRTSSLSTPHRAVDVAVDPAHSAILFRDARGLPVTDPFVAGLQQFTTGQSSTLLSPFYAIYL